MSEKIVGTDHKDPLLSTEDENGETFGKLERPTSPPLNVDSIKKIQRQNPHQKQKWLKFHGRFVLISYIVGLENWISFPAMFLKSGRLACLLPMLIAYIFIGVPMLLIELIIGQFSSLPPHKIWGRVTPFLSSLGAATTMLAVWRSMFFVPFMAQCLYLAFLSFKGLFDQLPWKNCEQRTKFCAPCVELEIIAVCERFWNESGRETSIYSVEGEKCKEIYQKLIGFKHPIENLMIITPHIDFATREVFLNKYIFEETANNIAPNGVIIELIGLWILIAVLCFFKTKVMGIFGIICAVVPFCISIACFLFVFLQEGNTKHLSLLMGMDPEELSLPKTWSNAVFYMLFSLSLSDGGVVRIGSHNKFNNNLLIDLVLAVGANVFLSFITTATCIVAVSWVVTQIRPSYDTMTAVNLSPKEIYSFFAFPEFASNQKFGSFFCFLYYLNSAFLGLPSVVITIDNIIIAIADRFNSKKQWQKIIISSMICTILGSASIYIITPGGVYFMRLMMNDTMSIVAVIALFEVAAFIFKYGIKNFSKNIETMLGYRSLFIRYAELVSWRFITPISLILSLIIWFYYNFEDVLIFSYIIPTKMKAVGWTMIIAIVLMVLVYFFMKLVQLWREGRNLKAAFGAHDDWREQESESEHEL